MLSKQKNLEKELSGLWVTEHYLLKHDFREHPAYFTGSSGCKVYIHRETSGLYFFYKKEKENTYKLLMVKHD